MSGPNLQGYSLALDDEFDGTSPDTGKWANLFPWGAANLSNETERYATFAASPSTYQVANGLLTITAKPNSDGTYTSGRISSQNDSFNFGPGTYIEARAQLPGGDNTGAWPAFWTAAKSGVWPPEEDVMEWVPALGKDGFNMVGGIQYHVGADLTAGFHTYGLQWTLDNKLIEYFDGKVMSQTSVPAASFDSSGKAIPQYVEANLAVGSNQAPANWAGPPDGSTMQFKLDYIRAYAVNGTQPAVTPQATSSPDGGGTDYYGADNAPGVLPIAVNDSGFSATENTTLTIAASALLANDHDPDGDSISISGVSAPSNGTVSYNASNQTVQFTPTTGYVGPAGFTYTINDGTPSGSASANVALTVNVPAPPPQTHLFDTTSVPGTVNDTDPSAAELGVKFQSTQAGTISGLRFYKGSQNTGVHKGDLWDNSGRLLATATFSGETSSGWQDVTFAAPVAVAANTTYVASYHENNGHYSSDDTYFSTAHTNGTLTGLSDATTPGGNGVYALGSSSAFPTSNYQSSNYWVDVDFNAGASAGSDDTLVLNLSEDAYQGDAIAQLFVDGQKYGSPITVTASNAAGQIQQVDVSLASIVAGAHTIGVQFTNDLWGGSSSTDRNLYVAPIQVGVQSGSSVINTTTYGSSITALPQTGNTASFPNVLISH